MQPPHTSKVVEYRVTRARRGEIAIDKSGLGRYHYNNGGVANRGTAWESDVEDARKLLDNGWNVLLFRDGLGQYSALAYRPNQTSASQALRDWRDHDPKCSPKESVFDGPHRNCGCGFSIEDALRAVTEKVLFGRLPEKKE